MNNIVDIYTNSILDEFCCYAEIIMDKYYIPSIFEELTKEYIKIRYYNTYPAKQNYKTTVSYYFKLKVQELKEKYVENIKNIEFMEEIFQYLTYLETDVDSDEVNRIEKNLERLVRNKYDIRKDIEFSRKYKEYRKKRKDFFKAYETNDFELIVRNTKYPRLRNTVLSSNIEMPDLYSDLAIISTFNSGIIKEDKLFVLYNLIGIEILKEILDFNYSERYLAEFDVGLFKKEDKLARLLKIVDNDITKDKLCFKIKYTELLENKKEVFELINAGYNFAVVKDENYSSEFNKLFKYVLD